MRPLILEPGDGERHPVGSSEILIKATSDETAGSLFLSETTIAPGFPGPPLHVHDRLHDAFYVLEGTLTMRVGDETHEIGAGTFVCAPPGTPHTFSNQSDEPVRFLNFNTPGGWEHYMRELAEAAQHGALTQKRIGEIAQQYDFRPVEG
jgi:mannose-6-phosphate isomerase-like protein (cupin superfamily)